MSSALLEAQKILKKQKVDFDQIKTFKPTEQFGHIPTGSIVINHLIGGSLLPEKNIPVCPGIPRGRITEIFGMESSGKTTLAIATAIAAQPVVALVTSIMKTRCQIHMPKQWVCSITRNNSRFGFRQVWNLGWT
jgi:RecA/RadA recombinase